MHPADEGRDDGRLGHGPPSGSPAPLCDEGEPARVAVAPPFVPWGTWAVFVVCAIMFAWETLAGGSERTAVLLRLGANMGSLTLDGEWWRLWGATFLHIGVPHIAVNMYSLWAVGPTLERAVGTPAWLALYAVAGLTGSLTSAYTQGGRPIVSAGASGALFGLFGALAWLAWAHRYRIPPDERARVLRSLFAPIVANLVLGYAAGFDNAAHVGGLVGGTLVMLALLSEGLRPFLRSTAGAALLMIVGLLPFVNEGVVALHAVRHASLSQAPKRTYRGPDGAFTFSGSDTLTARTDGAALVLNGDGVLYVAEILDLGEDRSTPASDRASFIGGLKKSGVTVEHDQTREVEGRSWLLVDGRTARGQRTRSAFARVGAKGFTLTFMSVDETWDEGLQVMDTMLSTLRMGS